MKFLTVLFSTALVCLSCITPSFAQPVRENCGEPHTPAGDRTGQGPRESVDYIDARYAESAGSIRDLTVSEAVLNGVQVYEVEYQYRPFKLTYDQDPVFDLFNHATRVKLVFKKNLAAVRKDFLVTSQIGTVNGVTVGATEDPTRGSDPSSVPSWWHGADNAARYHATLANVATDLGVPIIFFNVVPEDLSFTPEVRALLRAHYQSKTPGFACDDNQCDGRDAQIEVNGQLHQVTNTLTEDGEINQCLTSISDLHIAGGAVESKHLQAPHFYVVAANRIIAAAEDLLNSDSRFNYAGSFDFTSDSATVVVSGGSKRGRHSFMHLASGYADGAWTGHALGGRYLEMWLQRESLYRNDVYYHGSADSYNYYSGVPESLRITDAAFWAPSVIDDRPLLVTAGANDTYFAAGALNLYWTSLGANARALIIPNYAHGGGTIDHAVAFRSLVNYLANGVPMLDVKAHWDFVTNEVRAVVSNGTPSGVELWCSVRMTDAQIISLRQDENCHSVGPNYRVGPPDTRYAHFEKVDMSLVNGEWRGTPPIGEGGYAQYQECIVRAVAGADGGVVTSLRMMNRELCEAALLPVDSYYSLSGRVTINGVGLGGVLVDAGEYGSVMTDENGYFTLANVLGNTPVQVRFAKAGYLFSPETVELSLTESRDITIEAAPAGSTFGLWTGFLNVTNILELVNGSSTSVNVHVNLFSAEGMLKHRQQVTIGGSGQVDLILNDLPGFVRDSYGMVQVDIPDGAVRGRVFYYRPSNVSGEFDFAFGTPLGVGVTGPTAAGFNTFQPSLKAEESANLVANWLTIVNFDSAESNTFTVSRYLADGTKVHEFQVTVPPRGRIDVDGGHGTPGPNQVGLNVITPLRSDLRYLATVMRYGGNAPAGAIPTSYRFAFPIEALPAGQTTVYLPISSGAGGQNWLEVINPSAAVAAIRITITNNAGTKYDELLFTIPGFGQRHLEMNTYLPGGLSGIAEIRTDGAGVLAQSMFYFRDGQGAISAMYGSRSRTPTSFTAQGSYNLYLNMYNWLRITNHEDQATQARLVIGDRSELISLPAGGGVDLGLHETQRFGTARDTYGTFRLESIEGASFSADLLRVRQTDAGQTDFVAVTEVK